MKKILLFLVSFPVLFSCVRENMPEAEDTGKQELVFRAVNESSDTRSIMRGGKVLWSQNDSIAVFVLNPQNQEAKKYTFYSTNEEPSASVTFKGLVDKLPDSPVYFAVHPASSALHLHWDPTCGNFDIVVNVPSVQYVGDDNFNNFITVAKSDSENLLFQHMMSGFSFSVIHENIKSLEVSPSSSLEGLSGSFYVCFDRMQQGGSGGASTMIKPSQGDYFIPGKTYYAAIPNTFGLSSIRLIYRTDTEFAMFSHDGYLECNRGTIYNLGARDGDLVFSPEDSEMEHATISGHDVSNYLIGDIKRVEFITGSEVTTDVFVSSRNYPVYAEITGQTVKFHTKAPAFSATDLYNLFRGIKDTVESIDMGVFDFGDGNMKMAFTGLKRLKRIDLSEVRTSHVTNMAKCFDGCISLEELDLSSFNTANVKDMSAMFNDCYSLEKVNLSSFNTANAQDLSGMFMHCEKLSDMGDVCFDLSRAKNIAGMFNDCESLEKIEFRSSGTPSPISVSGMFSYCTKLTKIDISSFDMSKVEQSLALFAHCYSLTELNLGEFSIGSVTFPNNELFHEVASITKSCKVTCGKEIMEKLLHEADELDMFANSLRYIDWYVPGETEPVYRAPDYSYLYTSTDYSHDGESIILQKATDGNGIDIVIMGDYFSDRLIADGTYERDARKIMDAIFMHEPFKSFQNLFNVYMVYVVSPHETVEGIGALDSSTRYVPKQRLMFYAPEEVSGDRLNEAVFITLMNYDLEDGEVIWEGIPYRTADYSPTDYGSGLSSMWICNCSERESFNQVTIHEFGHAFGKLQDEYWYDDNNEADYHEAEIIRGAHTTGYYKNISASSDPAEVPWSKFLAIDRYVDAGLGVFEGGMLFGKGVWRPTEYSIMRYNTGGFNAPSREAIYYRIHKLAYGAEWEYSFEDFLEYDKINF